MVNTKNNNVYLKVDGKSFELKGFDEDFIQESLEKQFKKDFEYELNLIHEITVRMRHKGFKNYTIICNDSGVIFDF